MKSEGDGKDMNQAILERAARAAYNTHCLIHGTAPSERDFKVAIMEWRSLAKAAIEAAADPEWPLKARVWTRTSVEPHEKVLEIEGVIDDTHMTCRHVQSLAVADADVPGLPELYADETIPADVSNYARQIAIHKGIDGLRNEAARLLRKIETASSLYRDGQVKAVLHASDPAAGRIAGLAARNDVGGICRELDALQTRIVTAQRMADPWGKASLVLHTSEEHWDRFDSYQAKLDSDEAFLQRALSDR